MNSPVPTTTAPAARKPLYASLFVQVLAGLILGFVFAVVSVIIIGAGPAGLTAGKAFTDLQVDTAQQAMLKERYPKR